MKPTAGRRIKPVNESEKDLRIAALEKQLQRTRQEMRAFTYSVSHDLRAPLRAVEGFARILLEDYSSNLDEEGQRFLQHILTNAHLMSALIEDLLGFHRLGDKDVVLAAVDMTALTKEILGATKSEPMPEFEAPQLPTVKADATLIRAAWEQLIGNAVKFSKREAQPKIEFGTREAEGEVVLWVRDNGIGFDMAYADKLFQVFQKLQKEPDFAGNGIGLALVRRIADKHNGRVWTESKLNEGATFYFALPK